MPEIPPYSVPVPDPTLLTTEALRREITWLREITDEKMKAFHNIHALLEKRVDNISPELQTIFVRADELSQGRKSGMDRDVASIRELIDHERTSAEEKFKEVELRFQERDLRFAQAAESNQLAISAALVSVNNTQTRIENQFSKQIDQLNATLVLTNANMTQRLDDLKTNVSGLEGNRRGSSETIGWVIGSMGVAVAGAILTIVHFAH
jgi:hypothetical protein